MSKSTSKPFCIRLCCFHLRSTSLFSFFTDLLHVIFYVSVCSVLLFFIFFASLSLYLSISFIFSLLFLYVYKNIILSPCLVDRIYFILFFNAQISYIDFGKFPDTPRELGTSVWMCTYNIRTMKHHAYPKGFRSAKGSERNPFKAQ